MPTLSGPEGPEEDPPQDTLRVTWAMAVRLDAQDCTTPRISQHFKSMGRPRKAEVQAFAREEGEAKRRCGRR